MIDVPAIERDAKDDVDTVIETVDKQLVAMDVDSPSKTKKKRKLPCDDNVDKRRKFDTVSLCLLLTIRGFNRHLLEFLFVREWVCLLPRLAKAVPWKPLVQILFDVFNENHNQQYLPPFEVNFVDNFDYFKRHLIYFKNNGLTLTCPSIFEGIEHSFVVGWIMNMIPTLIHNNLGFYLAFHVSDDETGYVHFGPETMLLSINAFKSDYKNKIINVTHVGRPYVKMTHDEFVQLLAKSVVDRHILFDRLGETINIFPSGFRYNSHSGEGYHVHEDLFVNFEWVSCNFYLDFMCCKRSKKIQL